MVDVNAFSSVLKYLHLYFVCSVKNGKQLCSLVELAFLHKFYSDSFFFSFLLSFFIVALALFKQTIANLAVFFFFFFRCLFINHWLRNTSQGLCLKTAVVK